MIAYAAPMQSTLEQRRLGPFTVSSIGLGCMNLSHGYGVPPPPQAAAGILLRALDLGVTHFDTATLYGFGANEELVGRVLGPACRSLGATFVAFSPLARGFLSGALRDVASLEANDLRRTMPRFEAAAYGANLSLLDEYARLARAAHASMAQLALAWVLARGEHVVAIPGTTCEAHLAENLGAAAIELQPDLVGRLDALINQRSVAGDRYNPAAQAEIDTENF